MLAAILIMITLWFFLFLVIMGGLFDSIKVDVTKTEGDAQSSGKGNFGSQVIRALVISACLASLVSWLVFLTEVSGETYAELSTEVSKTSHGMRIKEYATDGKITRLEYTALSIHRYWDNHIAEYEEETKADEANKKLLIDKVQEANAYKK